jgi:outer membrane receptor protein involved in Fe transport
MKNGNKKLQRNALASSMAFALSLTFASYAAAQTAPANPPEETVEGKKKLDSVKVVGSRIKRAEVEGPSPVTVITSEQIEQEGFNTVYDALETLSQNTGFAQNDFNANGGFTPNASVINLRGMGPGRTLLLINGRRANDYPFPYNGRSNFQNFNNIPAAAVSRIEILAGGASAIYGSDAVAGVINVVLKESFEGHNIQVKAQVTEEGGRDVYDMQFVGGQSGDAWNVVYAFEAYKSNPLFAWERDFMDSAEDSKSFPGVNGQVGVAGYQPPIGIQLRRVISTGTNSNRYIQPTGFDCSASPLYRPFTYKNSSTATVNGVASGADWGPGCGYDRFVAEQTVANGNEDLSGYVLGTYTFDNGIEAWGSFSGFQSKAKLGGGVEQWFGGPQPNGTFYAPNVTGFNPANPALGSTVYPIRALTPEVYGGSSGTFQKFDEKSYDIAFGLRGTIADKFDWDATVSHAEYHAKRERPRLTVAGATNYFMGPRLGTTGTGPYTGLTGISNGLPVYNLNLARFYGVITPQDYQAMSTMVKYDGKSESSTINFSVSGDLFELPAGPVGFAAVLEASEQKYTLITDKRLLPPINAADRIIYNLTGTGGGGERSRYAAGLEISVPIFDSLKLTGATRFDKYDDITNVDDAQTWGAGLEWRPFSNLLIRGNVATSFKAPDMHYVFSERSGSFGTVTDFTLCLQNNIASNLCSAAGGNYNYSAFTSSQGNPGLQEETGKSWSAGVVWDITDQLSFTADYYEIRLNDEVLVQGGTTIIQDEYGCTTGNYPSTVNNGGPFPYAPNSAYCQNIATLIDRDPANGNRITEIRSGPINIAFRETRGIDANLRYGWTTDSFGKFTASLAWSHVLSQRSQAREGVAVLSYRDFNSNSDFRSRVRGTVSWSKDDWDATVFMNRQGSFPLWNLSNTQFSNPYGIDNRTQPYFTYNISTGYRFNEDFSMRFNINNVFDNHGGFDPTYNSYPYTWYGYDLIGRSYGLQLNYQF